MKVGDLEVLPVSDGRLLAPWPETYPEGPEVSGHQFATEDGRMILSVGGFLVRTGGRVVLIDAGGGPDVGSPARWRDEVRLRELLRAGGLDDAAVAHTLAATGVMAAEHGTLPASLAALGVAPDEVTDVVFTHLHFDHIGWASVGGEAYFPNATYRCARPDIDYFLGADALDEEFFGLVFGAMSAADRLAPVLDRLEPWDGDVTLAPGIDTLGAPGHTPGSAVVVVSSGEHRALLLGDVVHCPLELTDDEFVFLGDVDADLARRTRDACRRLMEDDDVVAAGAHFTDLRFGRLLPGVGRRGWQIES